MQYSAVQSSALHSSAIQCIVIKQGTLLSIALHCSAVQYSGLQCSVNTLQLYFTITMPAGCRMAGRQAARVCAAGHWTVLYCTLLCCTARHFTARACTGMDCIVNFVHCTLYCIVPYIIVLYFIVLYIFPL